MKKFLMQDFLVKSTDCILIYKAPAPTEVIISQKMGQNFLGKSICYDENPANEYLMSLIIILSYTWFKCIFIKSISTV